MKLQYWNSYWTYYKYKTKSELIFYWLLKRIFTIKSNVKKDLLFKFLDLEEGDAKKHWYSDFLSVSAIEFIIGWLFKRKSTKRWCDQEIVSNKHLTTCWPITENWRKKWDKIFQQNMRKSAFEGMMRQFEIR